MLLAEEYRQTGPREAPPVTVSRVNSAVEEQRVKLRFAGASCQSEEPWSTVAMVTSRDGEGEQTQDAAGECSHEVSVHCHLSSRRFPGGALNVLFLCFLHFMEKFSSMRTQSDSRAHL